MKFLFSSRLFILGALLLSVVGLTACDSPCVQLSQAICRCKPTTNEQKSCIERVNQESGQVTITESQEEVCRTILKAPEGEDCTCEALEAKEFHRCGLADPQNATVPSN